LHFHEAVRHARHLKEFTRHPRFREPLGQQAAVVAQAVKRRAQHEGGRQATQIRA
jgi:hypothetical protein